jgi:hypothetical protein
MSNHGQPRANPWKFARERPARTGRLIPAGFDGQGCVALPPTSNCDHSAALIVGTLQTTDARALWVFVDAETDLSSTTTSG